MIELAHPYLLVLILLPLPIRWLSGYRQSSDAIRAPFFSRLQELSGESLRRGATIKPRSLLQGILLPVSWLTLVIAAAQPQWLGTPIEQEQSARDLMVAVDLSGSMATQDFTLPETTLKVDRLEAVKYVLRDFAKQRKHDRLGLIVFGDKPYLQVPFTQDHNTWLSLLDETELAMAGQSTVIGDAVGLAIKLFEQSDIENRVLILLTDGNDTGSTVPPIDAAKVAQSYGITLYPIAIGDPESAGEDALDIATLQRMADITGGRFFQALNPQQLSDIQARITEMEPALYKSVSFQPRRSLHHYPIAVFVLLYLSYFLSAILLRRKQPKAEAADHA